jgi:hypothetical protein
MKHQIFAGNKSKLENLVESGFTIFELVIPEYSNYLLKFIAIKVKVATRIMLWVMDVTST